jgi:predicted nucleic acid-binding protein
VVNASPFIYLAKTGNLEFLKLEGNRVLIPHSVVLEVNQHAPDRATHALRAHPWLTKIPDPEFPGKILAWDLGPGESSVLSYGCLHPKALLILDDMAARDCAIAMGLHVCGTLGLILRAKKKGLIRSARIVVEDLRKAGLFLSDRVLDKALEIVGE